MTKSQRIRINIKCSDGGMMAVYRHLNSLEKERDRTNAFRDLLFASINGTEIPSWAIHKETDEFIKGKTIPIRFTVSYRDVGLRNLYSKFITIEDGAHREAYVKGVILKAIIAPASSAAQSMPNPAPRITNESSGNVLVQIAAGAGAANPNQKTEDKSASEHPSEKPDSFKRRMRQSAAMLNFNQSQ